MKKVKKNKMGKGLMLLCISLVFAIALWGCGGVEDLSKEELEKLFESATQIDELSYHAVVSTGDEETAKFNIVMKQENARFEVDAEDETMTLILKDNYIYTLSPDEKSAFKMSMDLGDEIFEMPSIDELIDDVDWETVEYLGVEDYNGNDCYVIEQSHMGTNMKVWMEAETGFPLKVIGGEIMEMKVTDLEIGSVPDSAFDIPEDYEILDFTEMMGF
ncbi:hypothetical protein RBH29_16815, partial [Herbivorax sp. ANBcel31]|uniref:LolA family protein n=1 Tax=Herbivorax sp. ANBcel31 TaxID=3069754 RepID=UPI0027B41A86